MHRAPLVLLASISVLASLAGCVTVKTDARALERTGEVRLAADENVGILFSSDAAPELPWAVGHHAVACLVKAAKTAEPRIGVLRQEQVYAEVFPGLDPKQVLIRPDTLALLVNRPAIRERLTRLRLRYLVLVGGTVRGEPFWAAGLGVGPGPGPPIPLGFLILPLEVNLTASVFDLDRGGRAGSVGAAARGTVVGVMAPHSAVVSTRPVRPAIG